MGEPLTTPGLIRLLARTALRRWVNRVSGNFTAAFRKKKKPGEPVPVRKATPRKKKAGAVLLGFLGLIFLFNSMNMSAQFVRGVSGSLDQSIEDGRILVDAYTFERISKTERWADHSIFLYDKFVKELPEAKRDFRAKEMFQILESRGPAAFRALKEPFGAPFPSVDDWPLPINQMNMMRSVGLVLLLLAAAQFFMTLGMANQDLGKIEWSMEWLFTFPVPARALFLAQVCEFTVVNPINWFATFPLLFTVFWSAGYALWALPLGFAVTLYIGILLASLRLMAETWLRTTLPFNRLKNFQAVFTVVGILLFFSVMGLVLSPANVHYLCDLAKHLGSQVLWAPFSIPAMLCGSGPTPWCAAAGIMVFVVAFPLIAVRASAWMVKDGLLATSGTYQGTRGATRTQRMTTSPGGLQGVLGKDVRLLFRDRNFLVQTLVIPLLIFGFQILLHPDFLKAVSGDLRHVSAFAFGLGAYVLMFSAFSVLAVEGPALWLLYTFPQELPAILIRKTFLWCGFAAIYTVLALGAFALVGPPLHIGALPTILTAILGVIIYAFIASGLGALATDPLETELQRRVSPIMMYLYMFLASMYAYAIYTPSAWGKVGQIVLCSLLAYALWQKVRDRVPTLLDPSAAPPPSIDLADGLIAALAFFVIQGVTLIFQSKLDALLGMHLVVAFTIAGSVVALFTLYVFWWTKVPRIFATVGLRRGEEGGGTSFGKALLTGLVAGGLAGGLGILYLKTADLVPALHILKENTLKGSPDLGNPLWLIGLCVLAAPLFEEFIFRGLVFRGLRRSTGPLLAVLGSAGIFAVVHPPFSVIPVFVLGAFAAMSFERTRLLWAPIATHMVYNAIILTANAKV